ncbi:hypothetical protein NH8B_0997 [Pseudogulbenkiania sp. NH8B]|uniref:hypothetical protein n=1 Tax=Pseudogulbenkiania sp. (strain NH8B) TaxID=748280 RepID=UPI0002279B00|nr:hypothetical protein [Pseudogulbenkiania sp. NH8B]BAK75829.1 hypothetical protein NH8B_0997 [Pseudogulbenkiania sp. NH8B]
MTKPTVSEDQFIDLWRRYGGAAALARHLGISERAVLSRRRGIEAKRGITLAAGVSIGGKANAPEVVAEVPPPDAELRALRTQLAAAQRDQLDAEFVKRKIIGLSKSTIDVPRWTVRAPARPGELGVPTLFASDWHWAEVVDPRQINGVNEYNLEIAHRRARKMVERTIHLLRNCFAGARYPGIVFALGGDMVSGDIHEELQATNEMEIMPTVVDLIGVLRWCIQTLADEFGRVFVPCVSGNHGRNTKKIRAKGRNFTSFDWLIYVMLAQQFADDPRVSFLIPDGPDAYWKVYGTRYMLTHGDEFRGGDGMIGALGPIVRGDHRKRSRSGQIDQGYDVLLVGHFHQLIQLQRLIVNGSLKGYDEFAWRCGFGYERARQALWITHPEHGITFSMPVNVDDGPAGTAQAADWVSWPAAA